MTSELFNGESRGYWVDQPVKMTSVAIFCGSRIGPDLADLEDAVYVGTALGQNGLRLIYGGGDGGLMGAVSKACIEAGGVIKGFNLGCFTEARNYPQKSYEVICRSIAIRKEEMLQEASAYIALAGGLGTLDEIVEAANEQYLAGYMNPPVPKKPIILISRGGLYDDLPKVIQAQVCRGYTRPEVADLITIVPDARSAIAVLEKHFGRELTVTFDAPAIQKERGIDFRP